MIRTADLEGKIVRDETGRVYGHVFEIQIKDGCLHTLLCGRRAFWHRLAPSRGGHRIAWSQVKDVRQNHLLIDKP
jgi:sporulation protein YlmC with PRC-barrel domain